MTYTLPGAKQFHDRENRLRILLTGAAGLIGGELAARLVAAGHDVTALVHRNREIRGNDGALVPVAGVHACDIGEPLLGFDKATPKRLWGGYCKIDSSKIEADLELQAQGFEPIPVAQSIVDMDLTFRKYKMRALSTSLGRAKTR